MANDRDLNFTIRANDLSKVPVDQAIETIKRLISTVNSQVDASNRGATSLGEFSKSLRDLENAAGSLDKRRLALIAYAEQEARVADKSDVLAERRAARDKAAFDLSQKAAPDKGEQAALRKLETSVGSAERAVSNAEKSLARLGDRLAKIGIDTADAADENAKLVASLREIEPALLRAGQAQLSFYDNQRAGAALRKKESDELKAAAAEELRLATARAEAERAVLLVREQGLRRAAQLEAEDDAARKAAAASAAALSARNQQQAEAAQQSVRNARRFDIEQTFLLADAQAKAAKSDTSVADKAAADAARAAEARAREVALEREADAARKAAAAEAAATSARNQQQAEAAQQAVRNARRFDIEQTFILADAQAKAAKSDTSVADKAAADAARKAEAQAREIALDREADAARKASAAEAAAASQRNQAAAELAQQSVRNARRAQVEEAFRAADAEVAATNVVAAAKKQAASDEGRQRSKDHDAAVAEDEFRTRGLQRAQEARERLAATQAATQASRGVTGQPTQAGVGAAAAVEAALPGRDRQATLDTAAAVEKLSDSIKKGTVSGQSYARTIDDILRVQSALARDAALVDSLANQQAALRRVEAEYAAAEAELQRLIGLQHLSRDAFNDLARAQATYERAAGNVKSQTDAYNNLLSVTRARKIDENDLAGALGRQVAQANRLAEVSTRVRASKGVLGLDSFQLQNLSFQINDVITQLSLGQGVLRTFESQGGQILQIFNLSIGQIAKFLLIASPFVVSLGAIVLAFGQIKERADALRGIEGRLIAIGEGGKTSAAGILQAQLGIERLGVSFEDAGEAVALFIEKGVRTDKMVQFAKIAQDIADVFGGTFRDRIKEVTSAVTGNYDSIAKLDDQLNFLSVAQRKAIRDAFDAGDALKGQQIALEALSATEGAAAARSRSSYTEAVRELTNAYRDLLTALGETGAFTFLVKRLKEVADTFTIVAKLFSGGINYEQFQRFATQIDAGTFKGVDDIAAKAEQAKKEIADLTAKREEYLHLVGTLERNQREVPQQLKDTLLDVEARLAKAKQTLADLSTQITPSGESAETLQRRLVELNRQRDQLLNGARPQAAAVGFPENTRTKEGLQQLITAAAQSAGVDPELLTRLQKAENGKRNADGSPVIGADGNYPPGQNPDGTLSGAKGVLQLTQATFDEMKALHKDIVGGIQDDKANALAGAYRLRQLLDRPEIGGDAYKSIIRYNTGPNTTRITDEARKEADKVTAGYSGVPLQPKSVAAVDAAIAETNAALGKLGTNATQAATQVGAVTLSSRALEKTANDLAEAQEKANQARRDATLRGRLAAERDEATVLKNEADKVGKAGAAAQGDGPEAVRLRASFAAEADLERADRRKKREEEQKADDATVASYYRAQIEAERAFLAFRAQLRAKANNDDKTDAAAQRASVNEQFDLELAKLQENAKKTGATSVGGVPLDEVIASLKAARDDVLAQVTADAAVASVNKIIEERATANKRITDDLKAGLISISEAFARTLETGNKFTPRIVAAVAEAKKQLAGQAQTPAVLAAGEKVAQAGDTDAAAVKDNKAIIDTGFAKLSDIQATRVAIESAQKALVAGGQITAKEGQDNIRAGYERVAGDAIRQIDALDAALKQIQSGPNPFPEEQAAKFTEKLAQARTQVEYIDPELRKLREGIVNSFTNRISEAFDTVAQSLGNLLAGTGSLKDVFSAVGSAFANMTAGILKDIATLIIRTEVLKLVQAGLTATGFGGYAQAAGAVVGAAHDGQLIGSPGGQTRMVDLSVFANARRYHSGGNVGLASDEVPTILQRGEQVLSKSQVRAQAAAAGGANASGTTGIRNVLAVGDREIASAMTGQHGERVIMNVLRRNSATIRKWV